MTHRSSRRSPCALATLLLLLAFPAALPAQTILVQPYLQPGNGSTLTSNDVKVIAWLTDQKLGKFTVEFGPKDAPTRTVQPERTALDFKAARSFRPFLSKPDAATPTTPAPATDAAKERYPSIAEREQHYFKYWVTLPALPFDTEIAYRVLLGTNVIRAGTFPTRASATQPIRFVMVGDLAQGKSSQNAIAWQISQVKPHFLVALGDLVYPSGRVSQYLNHFWPTYNQPATAGPKTGAPLMASIPIYPALGNHDAESAKLPDTPDAFGAYHFFFPPQNGPGPGPWNTPLGKDPATTNTFLLTARASYPHLGFYSFDNGPAHFLILDSAKYVNYENPRLLDWIERDLRATKAPWKFVCFHVPAFEATKNHYTEQRMRLLHPLFERTGVDIVWAGHVHNYQRSHPLRFRPTTPKPTSAGLVNGDFNLDPVFDGVSHTRARGIIHMVCGGGGASLYAGGPEKNAEEFAKKYGPNNWAPFTARFFDKKHSFAVVDLTPARLQLRALDLDGTEVDRAVITKP